MPGGIATFASGGRGVLAGTTYIDVLPDLSKFGPKLRTEVGGILKSVGALKVEGLEKTFAGVGTHMARAGRTLTKEVTVPLVGAGAAVFALNAGFNQVLNRMVGLAGVGREELGGIRDFLFDLAGETGRSPKELAEALYSVRSAGIEGERALDLVERSAKAAAAGMGDAQLIAQALTGTLNAYSKSGLTAAQASDILTSAVEYGSAEADEFAGVIGQLAPIAAQLGVGFDQVAASLAAMTKASIATDTAAVNISAIFSALLRAQRPGSIAEKALEGVGLKARDLAREIQQPRGILSVLRRIDEAFGGDEARLQEVFPEIRGLRGALALLAQSEDQTDKIFENVADSAGRLDKAFAAVAEDGAFQAQQALAEARVAAMKWGAEVAPIAKQTLEFGAATADVFGSLPGPIKTGVVAIGGIAAAIGPASYLVGNLTKGAGLLTRALKGIGQGVSGLRVGLRFIDEYDAKLLHLTNTRMAEAGRRAGFFVRSLGPGGVAGALGIATVALGVGAIALDRWREKQEQARQRLLETTEALRADNGVVAENTRLRLRNSLERRGLTDDLAKLNGYLSSGRDAFDVYTAAVDGSVEAQQELRQAILDSGQAGIDWGDLTADQIARVSQEWVKNGGRIEDAAARVLNAAELDAFNTRSRIAVSHGSLMNEIAGWINTVAAAKQSIADLSGANRTYADVQQAVIAAETRVRDLRAQGKWGTQELAEAEADLSRLKAEQERILNGNTAATDLNTGAKKRQLTTIEQLIDANTFLANLADEIAQAEANVSAAERELAEARADAAGTGERARAAAQRERDALRDLADAHDAVTKAQEKLLDARRDLANFESGREAQIRALELEQLQMREVGSAEEARQKEIDLLKFQEDTTDERQRLQEAVADAERGVQDATERVADAQRKVSEAAEERERVQVEAARRVEDAERNLRAAVNATVDKIKELGDEGKALLAPWLEALERIAATLEPGSPLRTNLESLIQQLRGYLPEPPAPPDAKTYPSGRGGRRFAVGGNVDDGWFVVGEEGPELGRKRGSNVEIFSNPRSRELVGASARNVRIDAPMHVIIQGGDRPLAHELDVLAREQAMRLAGLGRRAG